MCKLLISRPYYFSVYQESNSLYDYTWSLSVTPYYNLYLSRSLAGISIYDLTFVGMTFSGIFACFVLFYFELFFPFLFVCSYFLIMCNLIFVQSIPEYVLKLTNNRRFKIEIHCI